MISLNSSLCAFLAHVAGTPLRLHHQRSARMNRFFGNQKLTWCAHTPTRGYHPAGRVMRKAFSGARLVFYDLHSDGAKVQVMADARYGMG